MKDLPREIRKQAREAYALFEDNPNHPSLQFKCVNKKDRVYSVRISIDYRAVGELDGHEIIWFWIGPHAEYDKLIK
ncbi:MAG TPA: hypothetical protein VKX17_11370 [Planctomycetota bacterium]|nr:hypothetical protein [Planctomycetota bacterium]